MCREMKGLCLHQTDCSHGEGLALPAPGRAGPRPGDPGERVLHVVILHGPPTGGSSGDVPGQEEEDHVEIVSEPLVHPVVDDGVDTGGGHGQPVEGQVDVVDLGYPKQRVNSTDHGLRGVSSSISKKIQVAL